jgi:outer membrane protein assembly factor BamD
MLTMTRRFGILALALALAACGSTASPYQGMDAEALYATATQEYSEGGYLNAVEALDRLLLSFGDWDRVPEARLMLAHAHFGAQDFLTARAEYVRYLDRYAGEGDAPVAALGVCRSLASLSPDMPRDQTFTNDAILVCRNVVIDYAGTPQSAEAAQLSNSMRVKLAEKEYMTGDFYLRRKLYDSAIKYFEFVANLYTETEFAPMALAGVYHSNVAIGYQDLADEAKELLLSRYPDSPAATSLQSSGGSGS